MNKYVFICWNICNMGGAELYYSNKIKRLEKAGYRALLFSSESGTIMLGNLKRFSNMVIPYLRYKPSIFLKRDIESVIQHMADMIHAQCKDTIYIESSSVIQGMWAELLASKLSCKHILINLQENHHYDNLTKKFLEFKFNRTELYGIHRKSISQIFYNYKTIPNSSDYAIQAEAENNVIQDISYDYRSKMARADYNVGSLGRLDKPFVFKALCDFKDFAIDSKLTYNLVLIGGGNFEAEEKIRAIFIDTPNVNLFITGYITPVPLCLVKSIDCFVSTAGSTWVTMFEGIPTITMPPNEGKPIGILNYTTRNSQLRDSCDNSDSEEGLSLSDYLKMVLFDKWCKTHPTLGLKKPDYQSEFERQLHFFDSHKTKKEYYDTGRIKDYTRKEKIFYVTAHILGMNMFEKIHHLVNKRNKR